MTVTTIAFTAPPPTDFQTFTESRLLYDPGFNVIDATLFRAEGKFYLFFKDERKQPLKKNLRYAVADQPEGPFGQPSEPFTGDWVEGPSAIKIKDEYLVYFDHYAQPHYYGAVRSKDLRHWEDCSKEMSFPKGHRHGTVLGFHGTSRKGCWRSIGRPKRLAEPAATPVPFSWKAASRGWGAGMALVEVVVPAVDGDEHRHGAALVVGHSAWSRALCLAVHDCAQRHQPSSPEVDSRQPPLAQHPAHRFRVKPPRAATSAVLRNSGSRFAPGLLAGGGTLQLSATAARSAWSTSALFSFNQFSSVTPTTCCRAARIWSFAFDFMA